MPLPSSPDTAKETLFSLGSLSQWEEWERRGQSCGGPRTTLGRLGEECSFDRSRRVVSAGVRSVLSPHPRVGVEVIAGAFLHLGQASHPMRAESSAGPTHQGWVSRVAANPSGPLTSTAASAVPQSFICHAISPFSPFSVVF